MQGCIAGISRNLTIKVVQASEKKYSNLLMPSGERQKKRFVSFKPTHVRIPSFSQEKLNHAQMSRAGSCV